MTDVRSIEEFGIALWPLIIETHERGWNTKERPDASIFADRLYDILSAARIEVAIEPPTDAHGNKVGRS